MSEYKFKYKLPDQNQVASYIVIKGEKGDDGHDGSFQLEKVNELPITGAEGTLYMAPKPITGKNILNQKTLVAGYLSSTGSEIDTQTMGEMRSGYIEVDPSENYTLSIQETASDYTQWFRIVFFDANKVRISDASATTGDARSYTITTPANTAYLRLCGRNMADATAIQLEKGDAVTSYEPFTSEPLVAPASNNKYYKWIWIDGAWERMDESKTIEALARNQVDGNLRDLMNFEVGNISAATGENVDDGKLLRNDRIYKFNFSLYIPASEVTKTTLYTYTDEGEFIREILPFTNNTKGWFIPANTSFRIRLDYNTIPDGGRPTITDPKTSPIYQNFSIVPFEDYKANTLAKLQSEGNVIDPSNLKYSLRLAIADINNTGIDYTASADRRMATYDILHFDHDIVLPKQSNFYFFLWTYTDQSGAGASGQGWKYLTDSEYVIPAGTYFRLLFVIDRASTTPLYDIYDNDIFKAIEIYKKVEQATTIQYNPNMRSVAHQGYSTTSQTYGNSRLSSYVGAKKHGFDYGECDIKFSSDGVPVCCHDASFNSGGQTIVIAEHTWAELQTYNYYGETIASLEQVLAKCKELGLGLYIDHLNGSWSDAFWNTIFALVKKYQMQDNVYWLQGIDRDVTNKILQWYSRAKIVLVVGSNDLTSAITEANTIKTDLNEVSIDFNYAQVTVAQMKSYAAQLKTGVQFEVWTVDNATDYKNYLPYARGITSNKLCYNDVYQELLNQ